MVSVLDAPSTTQTATDLAYRILKEDAVTLRLRPGERIDEAGIAQRLATDRSAVREAMNRLVADDLVTFEPRRGFFRRRLTAAEVSAVTAVRADLEAAAVAEVVAEGDRRAVETVREDWHRAIAAAGEEDLVALLKIDERFHRDLAALARNTVRVELLRRLGDRIFCIRRAVLEDGDRRHTSFAEHDRVLEAILDGDAALAASLIRRHLVLSAEEAAVHVDRALGQLCGDAVA